MNAYEKLYAILIEAKALTPRNRPSVGEKFKKIQKRAEAHLVNISDKKERDLSKAERRRSAIEALEMLKHKEPSQAKGHWRGKNK